MLLLLLGCHHPSDDTPAPDSDTDTGTPATTNPACPDAPDPALAADAWTAAGAIPAGGVLTLATAGTFPVYAGSHSTGMWRTDSDDLGWDRVFVEVTHTLAELALAPGNAETVYRSSGGALQRTDDGGESWEPLPLGVVDGSHEPDAVWAVAVTPWGHGRVLAVLKSGASAISEDEGETFTETAPIPLHTPPAAEDPFQTWGWRVLPEESGGGRVVFTDGFGVATSDDAMQSWTRRLDDTLGGYSLVRDPLDATHLFVGGPAGLYESADEGTTWTLRDIGGDVLLGAFANDGSWLAFVGSENLYVSEDAGATFTVTTHGRPDPAAMAILDDGRLLLAGHDGVAMTGDRGATWTEAGVGIEDPGMSVVVPHPVCAARVFAASRCGGGLYRSEDYGATWSHVDQYFHYVMNLVFDLQDPERLWAVSDDKLLRSDDGGTNWKTVWQHYHFHGIALHPDDPLRLLLGSVGSGEWADDGMHVYASSNGGETWADSSTGLPAGNDASAHALLRWPGDPDVVLLGTYKGGDVSHRTGAGVGLWRSVDSGASWTLADLPVDDVAFLAAAGDTVFAATGDGLWRSTDEGVTWAGVAGPSGELLSVGFSGEHGLVMAQAGSVWKTDDAGDTWVEDDTDLPTNDTTSLAQVDVSADGAVGYATVYDHGVWRIGQ
jgi:photosystem II stability/assembly factor-like uncharacterized protein